MYYIGIDLGTSSLKLLLVDDEGQVVNEESKENPLIFPQNGWSEQDPNEWWNAVKECLPKLIKDIVISFSEKLHCCKWKRNFTS